MKRTGLFIILVSSLLFSLRVKVFAHVLKTDGSIGAVIHVSPDDDPIAKTQTDFFFEFKDKDGKFNPTNCDCKAAIIQGGKEIYSAPLFQNTSDPSLNNASFSYTFPEKDVYKVQISGKPLSPKAFQAFILSYDIRVAKEADTSNANQNNFSFTNYIVPVIGVLFVIIIGIFTFKKSKRENKVKGGERNEKEDSSNTF